MSPGTSFHSAGTGVPSGPVTLSRLGSASKAESSPSPPSASGTSAAVQPARRAPCAAAAAACDASAVPRNLSGAVLRWPTSGAEHGGTYEPDRSCRWIGHLFEEAVHVLPFLPGVPAEGMVQDDEFVHADLGVAGHDLPQLQAQYR